MWRAQTTPDTQGKKPWCGPCVNAKRKVERITLFRGTHTQFRSRQEKRKQTDIHKTPRRQNKRARSCTTGGSRVGDVDGGASPGGLRGGCPGSRSTGGGAHLKGSGGWACFLSRCRRGGQKTPNHKNSPPLSCTQGGKKKGGPKSQPGENAGPNSARNIGGGFEVKSDE